MCKYRGTCTDKAWVRTSPYNNGEVGNLKMKALEGLLGLIMCNVVANPFPLVIAVAHEDKDLDKVALQPVRAGKQNEHL